MTKDELTRLKRERDRYRAALVQIANLRRPGLSDATLATFAIGTARLALDPESGRNPYEPKSHE